MTDDCEGYMYYFPYTPPDDSDYASDPIIWMSEATGKIILYESESDWVDVFPAHPVGQSQWEPSRAGQSAMPVEGGSVPHTYYRAWYMNLNMRNILSPVPVTIDPRV